MTFQGDPYRTLGIGAGASLNEIKSAYRRLVKQYHPDAAGERALARFLSIQAAYERLVDGEGRLRPIGSSGAGRPAPPGPWRADPSRARASRDAWRARRSAGASRSTAGGPSGAGPAGKGSVGSDPTGATGPAGARESAYGWARPGAGARSRDGHTPGDARPGTGGQHRERHARRGPRKATPGSTTYDEAAELPLDPEWDGGAWYGHSSGTYWTINPREYADPRKHGPEYQARARRAAATGRGETLADEGAWAGEPMPPRPEAGADAWARSTRAPGTTTGEPVGGAGPSTTSGPDEDGTRWGWNGDEQTTTEGGAGWGTRSWQYDDGLAGPWPESGQGAANARQGRHAQPMSADDPDAALPDLESIARRAGPRSLLALARRPDWRWRLVLVLIGWPPIGYAVGSLIAELTGCAALAATCAAPMPLVPLLVQPGVLVALFLVPPAAAAAAFASIAALGVALPFAAVLSVGSLPDSRSLSPVLGLVSAVAYLVALAIGIRAIWRAPDGQGEGTPAP